MSCDIGNETGETSSGGRSNVFEDGDLPLSESIEEPRIEVDLSEMHVEEFPAQLFHSRYPHTLHRQITRMRLAQNRFIHFPAEVLLLSNLTSLDLSNNHLALLSESIGELAKLRQLSIRNNLLEDLPKSLQQLSQLEELNLAGNLLAQLPVGVYELRSLRALHLGANRLEQLSPAIAGLVELELLYLGGNRLVEVPAAIGRLGKLESLALADNRLESIPASFAELRSLKSLTLHNNAIRVLPPGIARLARLEHLSLRNNPLVTRFIDDCDVFEPPTLKESAARIVCKKYRQAPETYQAVLPRDLLDYIASANQCVNPKCRGVYFESCAELVKFVDFCGKFRVPLLHYICSPKCTTQAPACVYTSSSASSAGESDDDASEPSTSARAAYKQPTSAAKLKKILLG